MDRDTTDRLAGAIASAVSREINNHFSTPTGRSTSNTLTHSPIASTYGRSSIPSTSTSGRSLRDHSGGTRGECTIT